ncbi:MULTISPECIES: beta-galactosidase [Saccharothrix]|uniref:beta-galactosidase n=1 Tax=Saccharothrix TaxID=2071 RepID=UPI00093A0FD9|nr:beta-galactosidase [Saccharothrix sp. CB00851]OKI32026.1 beta-galactosidase [Saccharothrix sp. CB00851]
MLSLHAHDPGPARAGHLPMGSAPGDARPVRVDSRALSRNGRPWLPVMGEFHFSRFPESLWRRELSLMKAGGIDVVATYLFWNHHEEVRGQRRFDGNRDVRRFVQLCAELDLAVSARIGPWSHGECRNGGFPDWLSEVDCTPRTDDPAYLTLVRPYYTAIAEQLAGLWWGDGGPVVAVQVENELYDQPDHLATLRALAEEVGISAPLWTATGWGAAQLPPDLLLPLYGGYPEAFWEDASDGWAREVRRHYFATLIRDDHAIGADLRTTAPKGSGPDDTRYPYATCELGGGMAIAYHRRPLVPAADVSALALAKLASGSAWQGYYLYHGCSQRLDLATRNQESHATGYPNDLPVVNYDFQAPLGEYGQVRPSFAALRLQHLFLRDCGADLAPAGPHLPDEQPPHLDDRGTLRWSVRWSGGPAFLFVNNHQPHEPLPDHHDVRFEVVLGDRTVQLPAQGVTIRSGAHFAWPIAYRVGEVELAWASATPVARPDWDGVPTAVFVATAGVSPQFAFPAGTQVSGAPIDESGVVTVARTGVDAVLTATTPDGASARLLVLDEASGLRLQRLDVAGVDTLVLCDEALVADGDALWAETTADHLDVSFLPAPGRVVGEPHGAFTRIRLEAGGTEHEPALEVVRADAQSPPARTGGPQRRGSAPLDEDFGHAAVFHLDVPAEALRGDDEVLLAVGFTGDVARAYVGGRLVADHFWYGPPWEIGLRRFADEVAEHGIEIRVLPRPPEAAVYVDPSVRAQYKAALDTASVDSVRLVRRTRVELW